MNNRGGGDSGGVDVIGCAHAVVKLRTDESRAWWACEACRTPFSPASSPGESVDPSDMSVTRRAKRPHIVP